MKTVHHFVVASVRHKPFFFFILIVRLNKHELKQKTVVKQYDAVFFSQYFVS